MRKTLTVSCAVKSIATKVAFRVLTVISVVAVLSIDSIDNSANAETLRLVRDINRQSLDVSINAAMSNGEVSYFSHRYLDEHALWRATATSMEPVDLPIASEYLTPITSTATAFYYASTIDPFGAPKSIVFRIDAARGTYKELFRVNAEIREHARHPTTGEVYFTVVKTKLLPNRQAEKIVPLWRLDPDRDTVLRVGQTKLSVCRDDGADQCGESEVHRVATTASGVFVSLNDTIWFYDYRRMRPVKLHESDQPFDGSNFVRSVQSSENYLYYAASSGTPPGSGRTSAQYCDFYRSDGTQAGTVKLVDGPSGFTNYGNEACRSNIVVTEGDTSVFSVYRGTISANESLDVQAQELWRTDGFIASTSTLVRYPLDAGDLPTSCREPGRDQAVCDTKLMANNGDVWFTRYRKVVDGFSDDNIFEKDVSTMDPTTGQVDVVFTGSRLDRVDYFSAENRVVISRRRHKPGWRNEVLHTKFYRIESGSRAATQIASGFNLRTIPDQSTDANHLASVNPAVASIDGQPMVIRERLTGPTDLVTLDVLQGSTMLRKRFLRHTHSAFNDKRLVVGPNEAVYFCAETTSQWGSAALWRSDGTATGTQKIISNIGHSQHVFDVPPDGCEEIEFYVSSDAIYYNRFDDSTGSELWKANLDGTDQELLVDFSAGPSSSFPRHMIRVGEKIVLALHNDSGTPVAATEDGNWLPLNNTIAMTSVVRSDLGVPGTVFFLAKTKGLNHPYRRLWGTDGTPAGTSPALVGWFKFYTSIALLNDNLYFIGTRKPAANEPSGSERIGLYRLTEVNNIWRPILVKDLSLRNRRYGPKLVAHRGRLYFRYEDLSHGLVDRSGLQAINPRTKHLTTVSHRRDSRVFSFALWNNHIYYYNFSRNHNPTPRWTISRVGHRHDVKPLFRRGGLIRPEYRLDYNGDPGGGLLVADGDIAWLLAPHPTKGAELWQLGR